MPLVRNDENEPAVVQVENHRRRLVQEVLPDRTGRFARARDARLVLVQKQTLTGRGFV